MIWLHVLAATVFFCALFWFFNTLASKEEYKDFMSPIALMIVSFLVFICHSVLIILLGVAVIIVITVIISAAVVKGNAQSLYQAVLSEKANIDNTIKQKINLQPELKGLTSRYIGLEEKLIEAVKVRLPANLTMLWGEQYPELKSIISTESLADRLTALHASVLGIQRAYNEAVKAYNTYILSWPGSLFRPANLPNELPYIS